MKQSTVVTVIKFFVFLSFVLIFIGCSTEKEENLAGTWKFVSGHYAFPDTSITLEANANFKAFKIFSKNHYSNMTQDLTKEIFIAHSGTYSLVGDKYTENKEISINKSGIGNSATFNFEIDGNLLKISNDNINEVWEKID